MASAINSLNYGDNIYIFTLPYGTCDTDATTAAKAVSVDNFSLETGARVTVKFTYANSIANPTLNVNNTGAKSIYWRGTALTSSTQYWKAGATLDLVYNGVRWEIISVPDDKNTTYTNASLGQGYGTCSTAESTTAKVATLTNYTTLVGGIVAVKFTYAVPAGSTLNINNKGAKNIYHKGASVESGVIEAGDTATFIYDGSQYHLIAIDKDINNYEFITTADIDTICGASIQIASADGVVF